VVFCPLLAGKSAKKSSIKNSRQKQAHTHATSKKRRKGERKGKRRCTRKRKEKKLVTVTFLSQVKKKNSPNREPAPSLPNSIQSTSKQAKGKM
jgi:hypothetical protein